MIIIDEFEFFDNKNIIIPQLLHIFNNRVGLVKILLSSSKNDGETFKTLKNWCVQNGGIITYLNYTAIPNFDKNQMMCLFGEEMFELLYDSYPKKIKRKILVEKVKANYK